MDRLIREVERADNATVAWLFREMADLLELNEADLFRIRAYRNAARTIELHPVPVTELVVRDRKALARVPGVGPGLTQVIDQIARTGRFAALDNMRRILPSGVRELMRLPGLGPKRARLLSSALGIGSLADLERAVAGGRVRQVRGFGPATEARLAKALEAHREAETRFLRPAAEPYAEGILRYVRTAPGVTRAEVAGSYRRRKESVSNLDLVAATSDPEALIARVAGYPGVARVVSRNPSAATVQLKNRLEVTLHAVDDPVFGSTLYCLTGSPAHVQLLRQFALSRGLAVNERGVFRGNRPIAGPDEDRVLSSLGLEWIPPELREGRGEIEAAERGALPDLVRVEDIKGDLQSHTTDSDGRADLATMVTAARDMGYEYFAVTDHSPALRMIAGLDAAGFRAQGERIDALNAELRGFTVLKGAEVDILADGSLDLDDDTLAELDLVVASIHSRFDLAEPAQTERVLRALAHPSVDVLGHLTGRIIGRRPPIRIDLDQVLDAAVDRGVMLEVNAQPDRLDLDDMAVHRAVGKGIRLVISADAHSVAELRHMTWGVDQARRGWAEAADVANTLPFAEFRKLLHGSR